jgi:predicted ATP-binding protein involved in virulence
MLETGDGPIELSFLKSKKSEPDVRLQGGAAFVERAERDELDVLPVVAFYPAYRRWRRGAASPTAAVQQKTARADGYVAWSKAHTGMPDMVNWLIASSLERLQIASDLGTTPARFQDELEWVNRAVSRALPNATGLRYDIRLRDTVVEWDGAHATSFDDLSDGERALVALVGDIARRMCILNPKLGPDVLAGTPGVVLIDELDLHLHPAWQRTIASTLKSIFPKVQFIATSHSPQTIGSLSPVNSFFI